MSRSFSQEIKIGIIGGAGPLAGTYLIQKIIEICQKEYGSNQDAEFPHMLLLNYPFSDMLSQEIEPKKIESELQSCFQFFARNQVQYAAIACNTLHIFLPKILHFGFGLNEIQDDSEESSDFGLEDRGILLPLPIEKNKNSSKKPRYLLNNQKTQAKSFEGVKLIHLVQETKDYLNRHPMKKPLILCSSTSAKYALHAQFFPCEYPDTETQKKLDTLIAQVNAGGCLQEAAGLLAQLIEGIDTVVLGCSELSVIHQRHPLFHPNLCDPMQIIAEKLCKLTKNKEQSSSNSEEPVYTS